MEMSRNNKTDNVIDYRIISVTKLLVLCFLKLSIITLRFCFSTHSISFICTVHVHKDNIVPLMRNDKDWRVEDVVNQYLFAEQEAGC